MLTPVPPEGVGEGWAQRPSCSKRWPGQTRPDTGSADSQASLLPPGQGLGLGRKGKVGRGEVLSCGL